MITCTYLFIKRVLTNLFFIDMKSSGVFSQIKRDAAFILTQHDEKILFRRNSRYART